MVWKETKNFNVQKKDMRMNPNLPDPINLPDPREVKLCNAIKCKFNKNKQCTKDKITIGPDAQCLDYDDGTALFQEGV